MKQVKYTGVASRATAELDGKNYEFTREGMTEVTNAAAEELASHSDTRFEIYEEDGSTLFGQTEGEADSDNDPDAERDNDGEGEEEPTE